MQFKLLQWILWLLKEIKDGFTVSDVDKDVYYIKQPLTYDEFVFKKRRLADFLCKNDWKWKDDGSWIYVKMPQITDEEYK